VPKSEEFCEGYNRLMRLFESTDRWEDYPNPFKEGTDGWHGWEEAYYDLTQK
jgi:hypothetical protein